MKYFDWVSPDTVSGAISNTTTTVADAMLSPGEEAAVVRAGGIDLLDLMQENLLQPTHLVSLRQIPGLDQISEDNDGSLRIGAMVTLAQLAEHALTATRYPALSDAVSHSASPEIREIATLGGNLLQRPRCSYFRAEEFHCLRKGGGHCYAIGGENEFHAVFDNHLCAMVHPSTAATVLVALGAQVELRKAAGSSRSVLLEEFLLTPEQDLLHENDLHAHEILTAVVLPPQPASVRMVHMKLGQKEGYHWPVADVAVLLDLNEDGLCQRAAVVLGAAAPVPHRARAAEAVLVGTVIDRHRAEKAALAALDGTTPLAQNVYKLPLFEALVRRAVLAAGAEPAI